MHYLKCIELLKYALDKLNVGQRRQVSVQGCSEVQMVLLNVQKTLKDDLNPMEQSIISDVLQAIVLATKTPGLLCLTDEMKNSMVEGINELRASIALKAYSYFLVHEFEPTEHIIPLMRFVVECALEKGMLQ